MSQLSNHAENKLADLVRGQAWSLGTDLYLALASAAADDTITELSGTGYARVSRSRSLANWAGTQGTGTVLASSGTSHASSNNAAVSWGTSGSAWGTATHVVMFDAASAGNAICYLALTDPIVIGNGDPVEVLAGALSFSLGVSGGCSDYLANKLIDFIWRGQAFTFPATLHAALLTAAPSNAGGGTEVGGGAGYARVPIAGSLANWSGTQSAGSTVASTGTGGQISNNGAITFAAPSGSWGTVGWVGYYDASSSGNLIFWAPLGAAKTIGAGATAPSFAAGSQTITFA